MGDAVANRRLELTDLSSQHPGVPASCEGHLVVSAAVALDRHHKPPKTVDVWIGGAVEPYEADWREPTAEEKRYCADKNDTTCYGAYAVALAAAFAHLGLKAVSRVGGGTGRKGEGKGSDWYVLPIDEEVDDWPWENPKIERLEVSGIDTGDAGKRNTRLRQKAVQTQKGIVRHIPAYAVIVEFDSPLVVFARAS